MALKISKKVSVPFAVILLCSGGFLSSCGSGSSDSETSASQTTTEPETVEVDNTTEDAAPETVAKTVTTVEYESDISDIGFGNLYDDAFLEFVGKYMTGDLRDSVSDSQLFDVAIDTCKSLRADNVDVVLEKLKVAKRDYPADYKLGASAMMAAVSFYCTDVKEPFLTMATDLGL